MARVARPCETSCSKNICQAPDSSGVELKYFGVALERLGQRNQGEQAIMQFVGVARVELSFLAHFGDRSRIETPDLGENCFGQHAAHFYGPGAALFEGRIVEVGKRIRIQYLV